jgi:tetratricopeptide (TPR) repeat protein
MISQYARHLAAFLCTALALAAVPGSTALEHARGLMTARKLPEAQAAFERLAATEPGNAEVHFQLGELALRRDEVEVAVTYFEKAAALDADSGRFQQRLGDAFGLAAQRAPAFSRLGLARQSLAAYRRAVELDPRNVAYRQSLFGYYRSTPTIAGGGGARALAEAAAIKALDPAAGRIAFATHYVAEKKFELALAEFDEALEGNPDDYDALYQVGRLAALTGRFVDRGLSSLRRCLELPVPANPGTPGRAAVQWRLGTLLEKAGDLTGARTAYKRALELDPDFSAAAQSLRNLP